MIFGESALFLFEMLYLQQLSITFAQKNSFLLSRLKKSCNIHRGMVKSLTDSLVSQEEEERRQKILNRNEQLKKQIAEVGARHKLWYNLS